MGVRQFFSMNRRSSTVTVELPDGTVYDDVHFAIVANADPWTYVGNRPLHPTPEVTFETGLALYARRRMSAPGILWSIVRLSGDRPSIGKRGAHVVHDLESLTVRAVEPMPVQVDGDYLDLRDKLQFRAVPQAVHIVI
jgi:diacylglycerol kinase family enzyme